MEWTWTEQRAGERKPLHMELKNTLDYSVTVRISWR